VKRSPRTTHCLLFVFFLAASACASDGSPQQGGGGPIITTVAGSGEAGYSGDGGPATAARLDEPQALAFDSEGNLYIGEEVLGVVRKVDVDTGMISTVAGTGTEGCSGDGGPATDAGMSAPHGLTFASDGSLYVGNVFCHSIRRVASNGVITTVAGKPEESGFSGDGGPATKALLNEPSQMVFDEDGSLYLTDFVNARIRRIDPDGIITTIAGTGEVESTGDGGLATEADLEAPDGLAFGPDGNLYVTEFGGSRIRKIDAEGIITTVAGGEFGAAGDGGPATEAELNCPHSLAFDEVGNLYFTDVCNFKVRRIDPDGIITTVAGTGRPGFVGDGGPATEALLSENPVGLAIGPDGDLYVADTANHRIRKVDLP
jgi:sugar lactone lactonase YvrE